MTYSPASNPFISYLPSPSVAAPRLVPSSMTLAPIKGESLVESVTLPEIVPPCATRFENIKKIAL